jgi:hypothetical protein
MSTETPETPDQPDQPEREVEHPEREAEQSPAAPETEPGNATYSRCWQSSPPRSCSYGARSA